MIASERPSKIFLLLLRATKCEASTHALSLVVDLSTIYDDGALFVAAEKSLINSVTSMFEAMM